MNRAFLPALAVAMLAGAVCGHGQDTTDASQMVGLFEESCLRYAGDAPALRKWVAEHKMPAVPDADAKPFLTIGAGRVYGASNSSGRHALVSYDDGACRVVAQTGNLDGVRDALVQRLGRAGIRLARLLNKASPDGGNTLEIYRGSARSRHWEISLTSHEHTDGAFALPEIELTAAPAKAAPPPAKRKK